MAANCYQIGGGGGIRSIYRQAANGQEYCKHPPTEILNYSTSPSPTPLQLKVERSPSRHSCLMWVTTGDQPLHVELVYFQLRPVNRRAVSTYDFTERPQPIERKLKHHMISSIYHALYLLASNITIICTF